MGFRILSLGRSDKDAGKTSGVTSLRRKASPSRDTGTSPQILRSCRKPGAVGTCDISAALGSGGTSGILALSQSYLHQDGCVSKYALITVTLGTLAGVWARNILPYGYRHNPKGTMHLGAPSLTSDQTGAGQLGLTG